MQDQWTDRLSEYLDDELSGEGRPDLRGGRSDVEVRSDDAAASANHQNRSDDAPPSLSTGTDPIGAMPAVRVALADAQYDAAVADLERAVANGRGRLDPSTIA